ncbi:MAG: ribosome small subunit-dependent GTPase A [Planctomycetaceae bacterium]
MTRQVLDDDVSDTDHVTGERVSGKGELSRHRTIMAEEADDGSIVLDVDLSRCRKGRVLSSIGLNSMVQTHDGTLFECTIRRILRTLAHNKRNAVVAGDHVLFHPQGDAHQGVIERVEPRHGILSRSSRYREHILVANVDQALIVVSAVDPPLKPGLIDRFLISTEKGEVHGIVCINKADLTSQVALQPIIGVYSQLGYDVVLTSATTGVGLDRLCSLLKNRETVFSGQSGVGKSSLLNRIQPGLGLKIGEVSTWTGKGQHTTRRTELLPLDMGGWVVDTPGIRQLELWDVIPEEVEGFYCEFRPFVAHCRFPDCTHTHEDDCGVKRAVAEQLIPRTRYASFLRIVSGDLDDMLPH